jgi:chaperonin GroES
MKFRPLSDRILVERVSEEEKTKSGIIIPDVAREKQQKGKVLAVGDGKKNDKGERIKMDVKVGDMILFEKTYGDDMEIEGKECVILQEEQVLGIIEG